MLPHNSACATRGDCMWRRFQSLSESSTTSTTSSRAFLKVPDRVTWIDVRRRTNDDAWQISTFHQKHASVAETVPPPGILDELTPDDTRQLVLAEDELATSRRFFRSYNFAITSECCIISLEPVQLWLPAKFGGKWGLSDYLSRFTRIFPTASSHRYFK